jgi:hypothetical protein
MDLIGAETDRLTLTQQLALAGKWIATEIYDRDTLPLRRIAAVGDSPAECIRQLAAKGLDPRKFEFRPVARPF